MHDAHPHAGETELSISLRAWPRVLQWLALIVTATACGWLFERCGLPAARFLGAMLVAVAFGVGGVTISMPKLVFKLGQGCIGILVAQSMTLSVLLTLAQSWHVIVLATVLTLGLSLLVSLGLVWFGGIPERTAAWGMAPGAASAVVSMAEEDGADGRVVATMQYIRVVCVVLLGSLVGHLTGSEAAAAPALALASSPVDWGLTLMLIPFCVLAGARLPAGALLVPLLIGAALQVGGVLQLGLPSWLTPLAYGAIGCYIGLRFDPVILGRIWRRLPAMIVGAILLILLCAVSAWLIALLLDKDFLSVYLATTPGGLDVMAIIAIETHSDASLVLAMQTLRLFGVILTGTFFARQVMRLAGRK
ncbi:AbrB family transcriptional regulator [Azotobacter beijerinckii]|uniref:AbrB family transcriptional regulator n=1 Tax=Azotobacter beijerinckii TaxID=170623 RepID=UPI0029553F86|nr:AbrB family transcriptional regulator [Azotobacter beijerinckii]MDV7213860.1 AbrB family transcriptional regulator [Azotobacter beijerinckii]